MGFFKHKENMGDLLNAKKKVFDFCGEKSC